FNLGRRAPRRPVPGDFLRYGPAQSYLL
ncbi:unnamed protein product, partial [Rotaria sordida]